MVAIIHYLHFEQSSNVKLNLWNLPLIFHVVIAVASKCKIKNKNTIVYKQANAVNSISSVNSMSKHDISS